MTDPIADMLTRIRNAQAVKKSEVVLPYSKLKHSLAQILVREKYLANVEKLEGAKLKIGIKYDAQGPVIRSLRKVSKPGRRVYRGHKELPYVLNNLGIAIISTSQGLVTNKEARIKKMGGEVICEIY